MRWTKDLLAAISQANVKNVPSGNVSQRREGKKEMFLKKLAKLFKKEEGTIKVPSKTQEEIEKEKFLRAKKKYELKEVTLLCKGSPHRVRVALSMPYPDWCELQNSESWKNLLQFYEEKRSEDIQNNYTKEQLTVETKHL